MNNTYDISSINIVVLENYKLKKYIKTINVYINNAIVVDLLDLKNNKSDWRKVKSINAEPNEPVGNRRAVKIPFDLTLTARNVKLEFILTSILFIKREYLMYYLISHFKCKLNENAY